MTLWSANERIQEITQFYSLFALVIELQGEGGGLSLMNDAKRPTHTIIQKVAIHKGGLSQVADMSDNELQQLLREGRERANHGSMNSIAPIFRDVYSFFAPYPVTEQELIKWVHALQALGERYKDISLVWRLYMAIDEYMMECRKEALGMI